MTVFAVKENGKAVNMRLIDADELKAVYIPSEIEGFEKMMVPVEVVLQNIDDMPTVDAVPVVRCKDCIRFRLDDEVWGWCTVSGKMRRKDYCSYGVIDDMRKGR